MSPILTIAPGKLSLDDIRNIWLAAAPLKLAADAYPAINA